ncbi:M15 family peptidase [Massilia sp. 9096]|uniref:M15 family peptidase n=1 Tax=Massilia sp. 9096 TaxID=1500894 RepID=UPI0012E0B923|nr:M15 family peptidase [Massilia sp. 9096]
MSLIHEQAAFLKDIRKLLDFADAKNYVVTAGELGRSAETQSMYLRSHRSETMDDMHLRQCAIDLYFFLDESDHLQLVTSVDRLEEIGKAWEDLDPRNRWGGHREGAATETPRFERDLGPGR